MDDETIVSLYWARDESAIAETSSKYGGLMYHIPLMFPKIPFKITTTSVLNFY